jgi:UDP-N-acetylglucosamine 2-epimerase (non-hydrolysing)/UDP-GlcNAc3NAcA epimerase
VKILSVVGNRPQFIKSAPLSLALRDAGIDEVTVHTGQHYDRELSQVFFDELGLAEPEYQLEAGSGSHEEMLARMRPGLLEAIAAERPDAVLVYGDTNSTLAGALAAQEAGVPIVHVEAGLRSGDLTMPEERNRIAVDRIAALLLAPDERSAATLRGEGVPGRIEIAGDVMADATRLFAPIARERATVAVDAPYAVLTIHREANTTPERLRGIADAVNALDRRLAFPVHPRTRKVLDADGIALGPRVVQLPPLGYLEMLALVAGATHVLTDSGGLQKEAYWLGVPCVTLRPTTEWVDTVEVGANTLVDPADPELEPRLQRALLDARMPAHAPPLYGDGHASERIARVLAGAPL